jgi:hypothetical protein
MRAEGATRSQPSSRGFVVVVVIVVIVVIVIVIRHRHGYRYRHGRGTHSGNNIAAPDTI